MFKFSFILILLILSLFSAQTVALEVTDLYQVNIDVPSQAKVERETAIKKALKAVFLKIGGKEEVLKNPILKKAEQKANGYVRQYHYKKNDNALSLVVSFNEAQVNHLFKQANLALWGSLRPQVLLWLIDEQGNSRHIISSDASNISTYVNQFSTQRGLPIVMPLMDLTDNETISLSDFWGYFPEQITKASQRYSADTVIVMRVSNSSLVTKNNQMATVSSSHDCGLLCDAKDTTPKVLDWRVFTQGKLYTQQYQGVDKISLIEQGLSDITELIYQSYALSATAERDFIIEVKNITSLKSDMALFNFLKNLSAVNKVMLMNAQGDVRQFKLELNGSRTSFLASLRLNSQLTEELDSEFDGFSNAQIKAEFNRQQLDSSDLEVQPFREQGITEQQQTELKQVETKLNNEINPRDTLINESQEATAESTNKAKLLMPASPIPVFYWGK